MKLPRELGPIHFVGIGGIGMSGIAEVLINLGYTVQGSDAAENANVKRLGDKGATVHIGHDAKWLGDAAVVVVSTAIKRDNPELAAARERRLPVVRRAEMLAELMRLKQCVAIAGTHGKTTTTSLVATLLDAGGLDPTVINGGIINAYGTNARLGAGDWMVVEADESDGTFLKLARRRRHRHQHRSRTSRSFPHLRRDQGSLPRLRRESAVLRLRGDVPRSSDGAGAGRPHRGPPRHHLWRKPAGRRALARRRISTAGVSRFNVLLRDRKTAQATYLENLVLPMPGHHNALNATAAIAVAYQLGLSPDQIRKALAGFGGVKRRFTKTGEWNGVQIFDDYGHHPVEIAAVLRAARASTKGKVIAVMQPHRYTRLQSLFDQFATCFNDADAVIIADVYPGGRTADRGRRSRRAGRGDQGAWPSPRGGPAVARGAAGDDPRNRRAGRLRRVSWRRQHHAMGLCAARATRVGRPWRVSFPDISAKIPSNAARVAARQRAARALHLVSRRRAGAILVHAGGRGRPLLIF